MTTIAARRDGMCRTVGSLRWSKSRTQLVRVYARGPRAANLPNGPFSRDATARPPEVGAGLAARQVGRTALMQQTAHMSISRSWTTSRSSRPRSSRRSPARDASRSCISSPRARARSAAWPSCIGASQPNVSQHLAVLRAAGLVEAERDGREVRYRLADPDVMVACGLMRGVLERRLTRLGEMAASRRAAAEPGRARRRVLGLPSPQLRGNRHGRAAQPGPLLRHRRQAPGGRGPDRRRRGARQAGQPLPAVLGAGRVPRRPDRRRPRPGARGRRRPGGPRSTRCARPARRAGRRRSARPRSSAASTSRPARCRWTCSISSQSDLDPLVDGVEGVTAFYLNAGEGQVVFI